MSHSTSDPLAGRIFIIRGQRVILDADLALLYGVPTFRFNEAVKRNAGKFPEDFRFQLTREEHANLISQFAISSLEDVGGKERKSNSSQKAMSSRYGGRRKMPWAFTVAAIRQPCSVKAQGILRRPPYRELIAFCDE